VALFLLVALVLTNVTAYEAGHSSAADVNTRLERHIAALEADLDEHRATQAELKEEADQATLAQLRRDACALADQTTSRDAAVQDVRRRYGCTGTLLVPSTPVASTGTSGPGAPRSGGTTGGTGRSGAVAPHPSPRRQLAVPQPQPPAPTARQASASPPPPPPPAPESSGPSAPPDDDGLICLPLLGCIL
jgi:cell division protein FtsB